MITASLVLYKTKIEDLKAVLNSSVNSPIDKIYIVDNSPSNELYAIIQSISADKIEYIFGQGNVGFGRGNNIAIKMAMASGSRYHVVLNPDIIFESNVIFELARYMDEHDNVGQILPKVVYPDGKLQYLCKLLPTPFDIFARRLLPRKWYEKQNAKYEMRFTGYNKVFNAPTLSGCFMFLNTSILRKTGLFDERFFMYFEDNDLTRRIHRISRTIYYPNVTIIHNHAAEHRHNRFLLRKSIESAIKYFNKWGWLIDRERRRINRHALTMK